jgi:putative permease
MWKAMKPSTFNIRVNNRRMIFFITIAVMVILLFVLVPRISIPLSLAYIFSLLVRPFKKIFYDSNKLKRIIYVILTLFLTILVSYPFFSAIEAISLEYDRLVSYLPKLEFYLREKYLFMMNYFHDKFGYKFEFNPVDSIISYIQNMLTEVIGYLPRLLTSVFEWLFLIPLFLIFILKDADRFRNLLIQIIPNSIVEKTYYLLSQFNLKFGDYIFAKFIEATLLGAMITAGLVIMDFPFAFLLGIIAALTNILPYIGPVLGFIPALIIALVDTTSSNSYLGVILLYFIANIVDFFFIFPILVSRVVNLHPVIVVLSVFVGSQFAGMLGMIISIPFAAFLQLILLEIYREFYKNRVDIS